jgi:hypothetical protein
MLPTPTYVEVITRADRTCQCVGACGRRHPAEYGRCTRGHARTLRDKLYAAPADPSTPEREAWRVAVEDLTAWCRPCLDGAQRRAKKAAATGPADVPPLFDTDSGGS